MVKGKTTSGFQFKVDKDRLKDIRFIRSMKRLQQNDDGTELVVMLPIVLGEEQTEKLYKHCENKKGISPIDDVAREFNEICTVIATDDETKN